ncbi:hypothetical protein BGP_6320 [Beggiatoa sp. PS]|nr:hypothetical protein BGP_6320 [Beggiatoa sp. PS]
MVNEKNMYHFNLICHKGKEDLEGFYNSFIIITNTSKINFELDKAIFLSPKFILDE